MIKWLKLSRAHSVWLGVLVALVISAGSALAAVFIYRAVFISQVVVEPGITGLQVTPQSINFGTMAIGDWSQTQTIKVKNIGGDTLTTLYFETTGMPEGIALYVITPPIFPIVPGAEVTIPISLKAETSAVAGSYSGMTTTITGKY